MKTIKVKIEDGVLKIPDDFKLPEDKEFNIVLIEKEEELYEFPYNKSFEFLIHEPDVQTDENVYSRKKVNRKELLEKAKKITGSNDENEIINSALNYFIKNFKKVEQKRNKELYQKMKKFAGSIDGPEDLSTNKKYLEGYGS